MGAYQTPCRAIWECRGFLRSNVGSTRVKLLSYFSNMNVHLQMETAIMVDVGMSFVQAIYRLEGDGPLALICYEGFDYFYQQDIALSNVSSILTKQHLVLAVRSSLCATWFAVFSLQERV